MLEEEHHRAESWTTVNNVISELEESFSSEKSSYEKQTNHSHGMLNWKWRLLYTTVALSSCLKFPNQLRKKQM